VKNRLVLYLSLILLFLQSSLFATTITTEIDLKEYLDAKEIVFEDISVQMGIANWNVYSQEGEADQDTPKTRFFELFNDQELISTINTWYVKLETISDNTLKRRVEVWRNVLIGARVDMAEEVFKLENELEAKISEANENPDGLDAEVLRLMELRNKHAKEVGYEDYGAMMLELSGLGVGGFNYFVDEMIKRTEDSYKNLLVEVGREEVSMNDIRRMYGMFYRNSGPSGIEQADQMDIMKETLANIGFNFDELPIRFVEKEIPYGGNALAITVPDDMRIVMNVGMPLSVWMHEVGHGLHGVLTTINQPILEGYEWCVGNQCPFFGEGMAEVGANMIRNEKWQQKYTTATQEEIESRFLTVQKYFPAYIRFWFTNALFEVELYKDLSRDPKELRDEINRRLLNVDSSDQPFSLGTNIMYVSYPVYYQNYVFASVIALQVHNTLRSKFGEDYMFNKEVGSWLQENLYSSGELEPWREKVKAATGQEFDVDGYFKYFGL